MKFGALKSVAHNIADSLASGMGFMIGLYSTDVFAEASASPQGYILVDFITGTASGAQISPSLAKAISLYSQTLDDLCQRQEIAPGAFSQLEARFSSDAQGRRFIVSIEDQKGRRSIDEYLGNPGSRVKEIDGLGRIRPIRHPLSET